MADEGQEGGFDMDERDGYSSDVSSKSLPTDTTMTRESKKRKIGTPSPNSKSYLQALQTPSTIIRRPSRTPFSQSNYKPVQPEKHIIILHGQGVTLAKENPISVQKCLSKQYGVVKGIRPIRSGDIIIECFDFSQYKQIMACSKLGDWNIKCFRPKSLDSSQGCIYNVSQEFSEEELVDALSEYGVIKAIRLTYYNKDQGKRIPSKTIKLFFNKPELPRYICIGFKKYNVKLFIPKPIQCFKCQSYGHLANECMKDKVCIRCAQVHEGQCQTKDPVCANCKGQHQANYKECPKRIEKQSALRKSTEKKISLSEATKLVHKEQNQYNKQKEQNSKKATIEIKPKNIELSDIITIIAATLTKYQTFEQSNFTLEKICIFVSRVVKEIYHYEVNIDKVINLAQKCGDVKI